MSGELLGDRTTYNPQRQAGSVKTDAGSVQDLLDTFDSPTPDDTQDTTEAVSKVRKWLSRRGMPVDELEVYEHETYGAIQIEIDGFLPEFEEFKELMQETDGIGYDSEDKRNYCNPDWVSQLPADSKQRGWGENGEFQQTKLTKTDDLTPYVRYAEDGEDGPKQFGRMEPLTAPIPEEAAYMSPIYLLTDRQITRQEQLDDPWHTKGVSNIAKEVQDECEQDGRVLYPLLVESDALEDKYPLWKVQSWVATFINEYLALDSGEATLYFSGGKSIHAHIPRFVLSGGEIDEIREMAREFNEETEADLDPQIYSRKRQFRIPGVEHDDTGVPKIEIQSTWESTTDAWQASRNGTVTKPDTAAELLSVTHEPSTPQYAADGCGGVRQPRSKSHEYLGEVGLEHSVFTAEDDDQSMEIPLIEKKKEELPEDLWKGEYKLWASYRHQEFSPYTNASGNPRSVAVVRVRGGAFYREDIGSSRTQNPIAVPAYFFAAKGCDGEYTKHGHYAPLQLSQRDYKKWDYTEGDIVVIIGGKSKKSRIFEIDYEEAVELRESHLHPENGSRDKAKEFLTEKGYNTGSSGPSSQSASTSTQTDRSSEMTDAKRLKQQAEASGIQSMGSTDQRSVAGRILQIEGWDAAWDWFEEQYGSEFDAEVTWNQLKDVIKSLDNLDHIEVPSRPPK
jgi:hypothetical protein